MVANGDRIFWHEHDAAMAAHDERVARLLEADRDDPALFERREAEREELIRLLDQDVPE